MRRGKLKIFENSAAYEEYAATFEGTLVYMVDGREGVNYDRIEYEWKDYSFGDICLWDSVQRKLIYVTPLEYYNNFNYYNEELIVNDENESNPKGDEKPPFLATIQHFTPIGICVIPSGTLYDNYGVFMSLSETNATWVSGMDKYDTDDTGLPHRTCIRPVFDMIDPKTTFDEDPDPLFGNGTGYLCMATDFYDDIWSINSSNDNLWYYNDGFNFEDPNYAESPMICLPPLLSNGFSFDTKLFAENNGESDILGPQDGLGMNNTLCGTVFYHDAASACDSFGDNLALEEFYGTYNGQEYSDAEPVNEKKGSNLLGPDYIRSWYLPPAPELMLAMTRKAALDEILSEVLDYNTVDYDHYGMWSSTETSDEYVVMLNGEGFMSEAYKGSEHSIRPFCKIPCRTKKEKTVSISDPSNDGLTVDPGEYNNIT